MKTDCELSLEVCVPKEESDVREPAARIMSKLGNLNDDVDQYAFMETKQLLQFGSEKSEARLVLDSVDAVSVLQELPQSHAEPQADLSAPDVNAPLEADVLVATASALISNSNLDSLELDEAVNVDPHEHKRLCQRFLSTSDIAESDGVICGPSSVNFTGELEMDNVDYNTVLVYPDHVVYRDSYCTDCVLTFTSNCIIIEGSTLDGDDKTFSFRCGVQDILNIKSHWLDLVGMAMVTIHVRMDEDRVQAENYECASGTELKFTVNGTSWYERQESIASLNVKFKTLLSSMLEAGNTFQASSQKYFPNFDQPFEEVIYPKGDVDAVSMSKRDVDLLLPDTFVNDTVIDFYIKYLKNKIKPEERHRFHFFNSFFFRKLADPDKESFESVDGKAAFQRVRKWTRKVNLFEKDYVFIPVNYKYHWSLIVICHIGEVATYKDEDVTKLTKVPCVLHMDSIRGSHTGLKGLMQSYLREEWNGRSQETSEDISSRFDNLRFISLELPQQPNSFDCGLFLLHYVELFLEQAPTCFNPFEITKSGNFLNVDWFPPAEASLKRVVIQRLVYDLLEQPSHEAPSMAANDNSNIHKTTAVNFFPEMCNPSTVCQTSQDDKGIEISLLSSLSMTNNHPCPVDPSVSVKPASFATGSFLNIHFPNFNETTIQEDAYSPIREDSIIRPEIPYTSQEFKTQESWHENNNFETSPQTSISGCEDSLEVINGNNQFNFTEIKAQPRSPFMEPVNMLDDDGDGKGTDNMHILTLSSHCLEMQPNGPTGSGESSGLESDVQPPMKRMRSDPPLEDGAGCS